MLRFGPSALSLEPLVFAVGKMQADTAAIIHQTHGTLKNNNNKNLKLKPTPPRADAQATSGASLLC